MTASNTTHRTIRLPSTQQQQQQRKSSQRSSVMTAHTKEIRNTTTATTRTANHGVTQLDSDSEDLSVAAQDVATTAAGKSKSVSFSYSHPSAPWLRLSRTLKPWLSAFVWPLMLTLPLVLSTKGSPWHYTKVFPLTWYSYDPATDSPKPLGLTLGILATAVGQFWVCLFFFLYKFGYFHVQGDAPRSIQTKGARDYVFTEGLQSHLAQPGGFALLIGYLTTTWMMHWMPPSYYSFEGTIQWKETFLCLVVQDGIQYLMHYLEHVVSPAFYQISHKPHHRFTNPRLFDAYDGSLPDTLVMIVIPLFSTAHIVRTCNVWTYMAFGSTYSCWLTLIHSEYVFPWDAIFRMVGFGTPADHHVHHKIFKYNYGHLFMWFDRVGGTYKDPQRLAPQLFRPHV